MAKALTYPDIQLDAENYGSNCRVTCDGYAVENTKYESPHEDTSYGFCGTCSLRPVWGRVYWQVKCRIRFPQDVIEGSPLCQVGLASKSAVHGSNLHHMGLQRASVHVTLYTDGGFISALCYFNGEKLCDQALGAHGSTSFHRRLGFLLDTKARSIAVFDVDNEAELVFVQKQLRMSAPLYPVFCLIGEQARTSAYTTLEVEKEEDLKKHAIFRMVKDAERHRA